MCWHLHITVLQEASLALPFVMWLLSPLSVLTSVCNELLGSVFLSGLGCGRGKKSFLHWGPINGWVVEGEKNLFPALRASQWLDCGKRRKSLLHGADALPEQVTGYLSLAGTWPTKTQFNH